MAEEKWLVQIARRGDGLGPRFDPLDGDGWQKSQRAEHSRWPCQEEFTRNQQHPQRKRADIEQVTIEVGVMRNELAAQEAAENVVICCRKDAQCVSRVAGGSAETTALEKRSHGTRVGGRAADWRTVRQRQGQGKVQDLGAEDAHDASGHDWERSGRCVKQVVFTFCFVS